MEVTSGNSPVGENPPCRQICLGSPRLACVFRILHLLPGRQDRLNLLLALPAAKDRNRFSRASQNDRLSPVCRLGKTFSKSFP
jgi:hypothetical protein